MRQVHKVVLMVVDFDDLGEEGIIQQLESARRLPASVREIDTRDIDWDDSHPLNSETHWREKFDELFGNAPAVVEQVDALTDEKIDALAIQYLLNPWGSRQFARAVIAATRQEGPVQHDLRQTQAEIEKLHRELAGERLRADQGWARYESANADRNTLRAERAAAPVQAAPEGMQLVPRMATLGMMAAGRDAASKIPEDEPLAKAEVTYKAMLTAAPAPGSAK